MASLQAVYEALVAASPLLIPGLEFIAPDTLKSGEPLIYRRRDIGRIAWQLGTSLYYDHCTFESATPPTPPPLPTIVTQTQTPVRKPVIVHFPLIESPSPEPYRRSRPASRRERRRAVKAKLPR